MPEGMRKFPREILLAQKIRQGLADSRPDYLAGVQVGIEHQGRPPDVDQALAHHYEIPGQDHLVLTSQSGYLVENGLKVHVPAPALAQASPGRTVELFTHLHVRENELALYGCVSEEELALFELLLGVAGVGPRVALSILSKMPADSLRLAIAQE